MAVMNEKVRGWRREKDVQRERDTDRHTKKGGGR